jgi:hypothetical protein
MLARRRVAVQLPGTENDTLAPAPTVHVNPDHTHSVGRAEWSTLLCSCSHCKTKQSSTADLEAGGAASASFVDMRTTVTPAVAHCDVQEHRPCPRKHAQRTRGHPLHMAMSSFTTTAA